MSRDGEWLPFGDRASAAEYREWIGAQLTHGEQLLVARPFLDRTSAWWRVFDRAEGYAVVTNRRMFIVHADGAYEGRIHRPRIPIFKEWKKEQPPPEIAREVALKDVTLFPRVPGGRTVAVWLRGDSHRLRFRKPGDASDFENALRNYGRA